MTKKKECANGYNDGMNYRENQAFTPSKDVLFQEVSGETVLLDLASEKYFGLDPVGTRVWQLLNDGQGFAAMVDVLLEEYDVERARLEADVRDLLGALLEAGLIEKKEEG
jgi:hypothetical protein